MNTKSMAIARATGVIGATVALVVGVTFANFTASASLDNNTFATATAGLSIQIVGSDFASSQQGLTLTNIIPGTPSAPFFFNLRSDGGIPLAITAHVPSVPATYDGFVPGGFSGVHIDIKTFDGATTVATTTLADLLANNVTIGASPLSATAQYEAIVTIDPNVVTGSSAHVGAFQILFTGTQPN